MKKFQVNQRITLTIHDIGSSGEGVGYCEGYTVFVDGALPGELIEASLYRCQKTYGRAHLLSIITPSAARSTPPCPLFGRCGGCQLMHLSYDKQLEMKRQRVVDALSRIGKLPVNTVFPCLPSPVQLGYRNKIQLPVRMGHEGISIGFYARASHDLIEVESCLIHCDSGEKAYQNLREIIQQSGIIPYDPATGKGELRHLLIKTALHRDEILVVLVTNGKATPLLSQIAKEIMERCPKVKSVVHNVHTGRDNIILGKDFYPLEGPGYITERLCDLLFKVSPASFFQVNTLQAECLYAKALEFAEVKSNQVLLDAYCGVGTLSLFFAAHVRQVIGVDNVPAAIVDAQGNMKLNGIENASFVCAPSEEYIKSLSNIDTIVLNPPRTGCKIDFLNEVGRLFPQNLVYISCDPATLARDLAVLHSLGYAIEAVQPYDMFPQTAHVECVVKLRAEGPLNRGDLYA